ncbi:MAG: hypothetical protein HN862_01410 [Candidatus Scalindua sp.]|jgi:hypothetical protein|nr:hypothetical protein [Candidatus Scalindua sp.]MBT7591614.1 hypothetical protein [Candidatus Scalindua sp.]
MEKKKEKKQWNKPLLKKRDMHKNIKGGMNMKNQEKTTGGVSYNNS